MTESPGPNEPPELARAVLAGERRALARAITLVESRRTVDQVRALALLRLISAQTRPGLRVGLSGPPGVGKSTLIEALGLHLIERGERPAVLCVDPSSSRSGGSILGDKTRMQRLSQHPDALVRPSPAAGHAGGIARGTGEAILLCEAAGFRPTLVETVGVGQAESAVTSVVDLLVLLVEPGSGDELQGIKRGLNELGDVIVVNKADGERAGLAELSRASLESAIGLLRGGEPHPPEVLTASALTADGVDRLWQAVLSRCARLEASGELASRRSEQRVAEFRRRLSEALLLRFRDKLGSSRELSALEERVSCGEILPRDAVQTLISDPSG